MSMGQLVQESFGMSQAALNDPNVAVKVKHKIELLRPPEFTYLSRYKKLNKWQQEQLQEQQEHKFNTYHFEYKLAKAQEDRFCEEKERRIQRKLSVLEATDKETGVKMQYELDKEPQIHCLFIGNKNPQKPAGYYKTKRTMIRFREWVLEENEKECAWGRSLASTYPVKLNRKRWKKTNGDWRSVPAGIKSKSGEKSKHMDRLSAFYMRSSLWIPWEWDNYREEGLKIIMPSQKMFCELMEADPEYMKELMKFSKDECNNRNKK